MEGVLTSNVTLQQLALAAFIGPVASHEHRGSKMDQLVYLAIWSLARDWLENGCADPEYAKFNTGQLGRVGLVHWRRVYLRNANLWMELE